MTARRARHCIGHCCGSSVRHCRNSLLISPRIINRIVNRFSSVSPVETEVEIEIKIKIAANSKVTLEFEGQLAGNCRYAGPLERG